MSRIFVCLFLLTSIGNSHADQLFDWTANNVQVLSGDGFELGTSYRNTITVEHADGWRFGENFLFIDFVQRDDVGLEIYGEWYPRLNLDKLLGEETAPAITKRLSVVGGINASSEPGQDRFKAFLLGAGVNLPVPYFDFLQVDVMAYKSDDVDSTGVQITPAWSLPFQLGNVKFTFRGFLDWVSADATGGVDYVLTQPQLLLDVGHLLGSDEQLYLGVEYWYWHNKFGIDGLTEQSAQAMLLYSF